MQTLEIPMPSELIQAYELASPEEQERVHVWVKLLLQNLAQPNPMTLERAMNQLAYEAAQNQLTPDILADELMFNET